MKQFKCISIPSWLNMLYYAILYSHKNRSLTYIIKFYKVQKQCEKKKNIVHLYISMYIHLIPLEHTVVSSVTFGEGTWVPTREG